MTKRNKYDKHKSNQYGMDCPNTPGHHIWSAIGSFVVTFDVLLRRFVADRCEAMPRQVWSASDSRLDTLPFLWVCDWISVVGFMLVCHVNISLARFTYISHFLKFTINECIGFAVFDACVTLPLLTSARSLEHLSKQYKCAHNTCALICL
jgi:hypothetical protein